MLKPLFPLLGVCVLAAACGSSGSSSPAAPSSTPSAGSTTPATPTTATTTTTTTSGLFTFTFEAGTQVSDQDLVKNAFTAASSFYQSAVGRTVTQATTVKLAGSGAAGCTDPGASAFTGQRTMTICGANNGWTVHNTLNRTKILTHVFFHLIQFEMRWLGNPSGISGSQWLAEGSAEYLGWRGVANSGLVALDTARGCNVNGANAKGAGAGASLDTLESPAAFGVPYAYELSMLGVDQLVNSAAGMPSLITYGTAIANGTAYALAFQQAFGTSTTSFYSGFPAYRSSLSGLSSTACGT
jgi:hypothetical protein